MSEYSAEELLRLSQFVKDVQSVLGGSRDDNDDDEARAWDDYEKASSALAAYAERIKADERAKGRIDFKGMWNAMSDRAYAHPPAQAAQVDQVGELLAIIHGDGGHYQAEHGLQKAAKDAQEKVIQMMTKIATAEPVAQPADSGRVPDGWVLVPVELTVGMKNAAEGFSYSYDLDDAWHRLLAAAPESRDE